MSSESCASSLGQSLRLLTEQSAFEPFILLAQMLHELPVLVALFRDGGDLCSRAATRLLVGRAVAHVVHKCRREIALSSSISVSGGAAPSPSAIAPGDAGEQRGQGGGVDVQHALPSGRDGQLESRLVKALVQQAEAVPVEPQYLQARCRSSAEHEYRATVDRIAAHTLAGQLGEPIEPESHVDRLDAKEDTHAVRNHVPASTTASSAFSAEAS